MADVVQNDVETVYAYSDLFRAAAAAEGRLGLCHRGEATHSIAIAYSYTCDRFPSSDPSFASRCPRALKTLCGRLEIVDRRDDHALISAAGHHRHPRRCHRTTIARPPLRGRTRERDPNAPDYAPHPDGLRPQPPP